MVPFSKSKPPVRLQASVPERADQWPHTATTGSSTTASKGSRQLWPAAGMSVGQHLLLAYLKSLQAVMAVQFTHKGLRGGRSGVVKLAEESPIVQVRTCLLEACSCHTKHRMLGPCLALASCTSRCSLQQA